MSGGDGGAGTDTAARSVSRRAARAPRAVLRFWRYLYGDNPLHLLSVLGCFALSGYVVAQLWDDPSIVALGIWFAGAVLGHDLLLYPLYALADQPLTISRWARRRLLPDRPPVVPAINHVRVPVLGSALLGLIWFPSITGRGGEAFAFTAGHAAVGQYENWLLITGALFIGSAVVYALRLGAAAGRGVVGLVRRRSAARSPATAEDERTPAAAATSVPDPSADATVAFPAPDADPTEVFATPEVEAALDDESAPADDTVTDVVSGNPDTVPDADGGGAERRRAESSRRQDRAGPTVDDVGATTAPGPTAE